MTVKEIVYTKIPSKCDRWMKQKANIILAYKNNHHTDIWKEETKSLRGYLECLMALDYITESDKRRLFHHYADIRKPFAIESEASA